jgi:hypothetical protein
MIWFEAFAQSRRFGQPVMHVVQQMHLVAKFDAKRFKQLRNV